MQWISVQFLLLFYAFLPFFTLSRAAQKIGEEGQVIPCSLLDEMDEKK